MEKAITNSVKHFSAKILKITKILTTVDTTVSIVDIIGNVIMKIPARPDLTPDNLPPATAQTSSKNGVIERMTGGAADAKKPMKVWRW